MKTVNTNALLQGQELAPKIELLLKISGKSSEKVKGSVRAHLVEGMPKPMVHMAYGISQQQLDKALADLNQLQVDVIEYNNIF